MAGRGAAGADRNDAVRIAKGVHANANHQGQCGGVTKKQYRQLGPWRRSRRSSAVSRRMEVPWPMPNPG